MQHEQKQRSHIGLTKTHVHGFLVYFVDFWAEHHSARQIIKPIHGICQWDVRETPTPPRSFGAAVGLRLDSSLS